MQLLPLQSSVFMMHFSNAFWNGNEAFPKVISQNIIAPLHVIFHYIFTCVIIKIKTFCSCRTCIVGVARVLHSCRLCSTRVTLVSHFCCSYLICVAFVSLVSGTRVLKQTRSNFSIQLLQSPFKFEKLHLSKLLRYAFKILTQQRNNFA